MQKTLSFLLAMVTLLACLCPAASVAGEVAPMSLVQSGSSGGMIRVWLSSIRGNTTYNLTLAGTYTFAGQTLYSGSRVKVEFSGGVVYVTVDGGARTAMGSSVTLGRQGGGVKIAESLSPANTYPGDMRFFYSGSTSYVVCTLYIEDYIYGVLPYEMSNSFPLEALKAQAVAARTFAAYSLKSGGTYDVTDTVSYQVFRGVDSGKSRCIQAADETKGMVLKHNGGYIEASFGASNGGQTETRYNAWGGTSAMGYQQVKDDPFDLANTASVVKSYTIYETPGSGQSSVAYTMLQNALVSRYGGYAGQYSIERVTGVSVHTPKYAAPSRVYTTMTVSLQYSGGKTASVDLPLFASVKRALGLNINSTDNELFTVDKVTGGYRVSSRRYGHGIGMSQRGAQQMANMGYSFLDILGFYYQGAQLIRVSFSSNWSGGSPPSATDSVTDLPTVAPGGTATGRVTLENAGSRLNVRSGPDTSYGTLGTIPNGATVIITGTQGSWYAIQYGSVTGYVSSRYVTKDGMVDPAPTTMPGAAIATVVLENVRETLNLRAEASMYGQIVTKLAHGTVLTVVEQGPVWTQVRYGVLTGYVMNRYIVITNTNAPTASPLPTATPVTMQRGVVTLSSGMLNMRNAPDGNAGIVTRLPNGATVVVTETGDIWCRVVYGVYEGYVMRRYLFLETISVVTAPPQPTATPTAVAPLKGIISLSSGRLNLRSAPSTDAKSLALIPNGAEVTVTNMNDVWCEVTYAGSAGYVMRRYVLIQGNSVVTTPAPTAIVNASTAWVTSKSGGKVNIRAGQSTNTAILGTAPYGAEVAVLEAGLQWSRIQYGGTVGYMANNYLVFSTVGQTPGVNATATFVAAPTAQPTDAPTQVIIATDSGRPINLRNGASLQSQVVLQIPSGASAVKLSAVDTWTYIQYNGQLGYVASEYVRAGGNTLIQQNVAAMPGAIATPTMPPTLRETVVNEGTVRSSAGTGSATVRRTPNAQAEGVATLPEGTAVEVLGYEGAGAQWLRIRCGNVAGYALRSDFALSQRVGVVRLQDGSGSLNVRAAPSEDGDIVGRVGHGLGVTVLEESGGWVRVRLESGATGYALAAYLEN